MATDVARISFDSGRKYTVTVPQQGRVSLEAEENEQHAIDDAERLADLRDIIGPAGTPDNGYSVTDGGGGDIDIGPGTMYVGGLRVTLDGTIDYNDQPDWVDHDGDPLFTPINPQITGNEHVMLVLTEYDVTATEDPVLREVALGGPDGAARQRIVQRVRRLATTASDCQGAEETDQQIWQNEGLTFDLTTMRLISDSSLQVGFTGPPPPSDPCEPTASGGYLGAENQVIRVQVAAAYPDSNTFDLVWAWDNGSALYRVTPGTGGQFALDRAPVDDYHNPRAGQPVEMLRSAATLTNTDGAVEGWIAELTGQVAVLAAPYDPDTKTLVYPAALPNQYLDPKETPQLYLRVWEELHAGVAPSDTVTLTGTGLSVTLTIPNGIAHPGDYWSIAVRPATPATVLPDCLLNSPQPPDGPRMWACPLAVIGWNAGAFQLLDDCRVPFPPLTGITPGAAGCCMVSAGPADAGKLQQIIDQATAGRQPHDVSQRVTVCLRPGVYLLPEPLLLEAAHGELHLEGCGGGAVLAAAPAKEANFALGMIIMLRADAVTISGITFNMPLVPVQAVPKTAGMTRAADPRITALYRGLVLSAGLRPIACQDLTVVDCTFNFDPPASSSSAASVARSGGPAAPRSSTATTQVLATVSTVFSVGIFTAGQCDRLSVIGSQFTHDTSQATGPGLQIRVGLLSLSVLTWAAPAGRIPEFLFTSQLDDAVIRGNNFTGLTMGVGVLGHVGGIRLDDNTLRDCYGGIWLISFDAIVYLDLVGAYKTTGITQETMAGINLAVRTAMLDPVLMFLVAVGSTLQLPAAAAPIVAAAGTQAGGQPTTAEEWTTRFVRRLTDGPFRPAAPATPADAPSDEESAELAQTQFGGVASSRADLVAAGGVQAVVREAALTVADLARAFPLAADLQSAVFQVHGNVLDCFQPNLVQATSGASVSSPTGAALLIWDFSAKRASGPPGGVIIDANEFSANCLGPVVTVLLATKVVATGNVVSQSQVDGRSLVVLGTIEGAAITGNFLSGIPVLPAGRAYPPPLDTWLPLNMVN